jgi:hypothetical protein
LEVSGQLQLAALTPGKKTPATTIQEAGWTQELVWTVWRSGKFLALLGLKPEPMVGIASCCSDCIISAPNVSLYLSISCVNILKASVNAQCQIWDIKYY